VLKGAVNPINQSISLGGCHFQQVFFCVVQVLRPKPQACCHRGLRQRCVDVDSRCTHTVVSGRIHTSAQQQRQRRWSAAKVSRSCCGHSRRFGRRWRQSDKCAA